ncbi:unnamed protein product [Rhizoctonia solani]|uniref:Uncharacterized protein n=1 Tax=Rhizoctonia solani TaxID=456999 RepID=A0A8H3AU73_9AGAM|nr:unnamed protein product [Rhizoctonia solani]
MPPPSNDLSDHSMTSRRTSPGRNAKRKRVAEDHDGSAAGRDDGQYELKEPVEQIEPTPTGPLYTPCDSTSLNSLEEQLEVNRGLIEVESIPYLSKVGNWIRDLETSDFA